MDSIKELKTEAVKYGSKKKDNRVKTRTDVDYLLESIPQLDKICDVRKKIGQGTFSKVYYGETKIKNKNYPSLWAIKHLVPTTHPSRALSEIACLKLIGGTENVIAAVHCLRNKNHIALIMPYVHSDNFRNYVGKLKPQELCYYMQQLLIALRRVHSCNYIHRDVKPSNFLYSRSSDKCVLIDFGLVQKCNPIGILTTENSSSPSQTSLGKRVRECNEADEVPSAKKIMADFSSSKDPISYKPPGNHLLESPPRDTSANKIQINGYVNGSVMDSPSKHTRAAENTRKANELGNLQKQSTSTLHPSQVPPVSNTVSKQQPNKPTDKTSGYSSKLSLQQVRTRSGRSELRMLKNTCNCFGNPRVCRICLGKPSQFAHRSGTPGFRPPEVLLKHPNQTAAVDVWSAGVILLCLLSGRYPFFQAVDDCTALAEICSLLGTQAIRKSAEKLQKKFIASDDKPALSLFIVCETLRNNGSYCDTCKKKNCSCSNKADKKAENTTDESNGFWDIAYPREFYDLLGKLLDPNPFSRITSSDALNHRLFSLYSK